MGDRQEIANSVEALMLLITPKMIDPEFLASLEELDQKWKTKQEDQDRTYRKRIKSAAHGCPDLIEKPTITPDAQHFKKSFMIALALFERRNLMLKIQTEDEV